LRKKKKMGRLNNEKKQQKPAQKTGPAITKRENASNIVVKPAVGRIFSPE